MCNIISDKTLTEYVITRRLGKRPEDNANGTEMIKPVRMYVSLQVGTDAQVST